MKKKISSLIINQFNYVEKIFKFKVVNIINKKDYSSVTYESPICTLEVSVGLEYRDVFVTFFFPDHKNVSARPRGFSLDDYVYVKTGSYPRLKGVLNYYNVSEVNAVLILEASILKEYGNDVLAGDFSAYPKILKVMNKRRAELENPLKKKYPHFFGVKK